MRTRWGRRRCRRCRRRWTMRSTSVKRRSRKYSEYNERHKEDKSPRIR